MCSPVFPGHASRSLPGTVVYGPYLVQSLWHAICERRPRSARAARRQQRGDIPRHSICHQQGEPQQHQLWEGEREQQVRGTTSRTASSLRRTERVSSEIAEERRGCVLLTVGTERGDWVSSVCGGRSKGQLTSPHQSSPKVLTDVVLEGSIVVNTVHAGCPDAHVSECPRGEREKKEGSRKARHASCRLKRLVEKGEQVKGE